MFTRVIPYSLPSITTTFSLDEAEILADGLELTLTRQSPPMPETLATALRTLQTQLRAGAQKARDRL